MLKLSTQQRAKLGLELAATQQEHSDLDAAIAAMTQTHKADPMVLQRLKKRKLALKDTIAKLDRLLLPDIIA